MVNMLHKILESIRWWRRANEIKSVETTHKLLEFMFIWFPRSDPQTGIGDGAAIKEVDGRF